MSKLFDRNKANDIRNDIQERVTKIFPQNRRMLLTWATGCGKTLAALKMIESYYNHDNQIKGYLICKENSHLSNWTEDIATHGKNFFNDCTEQFLYDSLHRFNDKGYVDFVVLDECHAVTERRLEYLMDIVGPNTAIIMLSATVNPDKLELLNVLCRGKMTVSNISISEAIKRGILPFPKIYVHNYKLDNVHRNQEFIFVQGNKKLRVEKKCLFNETKDMLNTHPNLHLIVLCTEQECYNLITADLNTYRGIYFSTKSQWAKTKWVNQGSRRKRFIAEIKTNRAKTLIDKSFKGYRFICFTGSKVQCEELGGDNFIHSGLDPKIVVSKKDEFNDGKLNELFVVNMFRESINLKNVQRGLVVQLDNVKLTFIQMLGRVFRSDLPELHLMVMTKTQDENYLKNVSLGLDKNFIIKIDY